MNTDECLPAIATQGEFAEDGDPESGRKSVSHLPGWRAGKRVSSFSIGMPLRRRQGGELVEPRYFSEGNQSLYIVHYNDCAIAWIDANGVWKTIHTFNFCGAPQVAQVEAVLAAAGISWEELT